MGGLTCTILGGLTCTILLIGHGPEEKREFQNRVKSICDAATYLYLYLNYTSTACSLLHNPMTRSKRESRGNKNGVNGPPP